MARRASYSSEQLAAAQAVGPPRAEATFSTRDEWNEYQNAWFREFTSGETLPAVGDPNRAKRWKASRRQHGKIEEQRAAVEVDVEDRAPPSLQRKQRQQQTMQRNRSDPQYCERELQAQRDKRANDFALREDASVDAILEAVHDASGSTITANSRRLLPLQDLEDAQKIVNSRLDQQETLFAQLLVTAGAAATADDAQERWFTAAHCLGIMSARHETLFQFVDELHAGLCEYLELQAHPWVLPRFDGGGGDELLAAPIARLGWSEAQLAQSGTITLAAWTPRGRVDAWTPLPGLEDAVTVKTPTHHHTLRATRNVFTNDEQRLYILKDPGEVGNFPGLEYGVASSICLACDQWLQLFAGGAERDLSDGVLV